MKYFKSIVVFVFVLTVLSIQAVTAQPLNNKNNGVAIAMCRPAVSQIKNIEDMYEKDIIPLLRIKLIGVYHEDEKTDYQPSYDYVKKNNLTWVTFKVIKGTVKPADLFKKNLWTAQFREIFDGADGIIFTGGADIPPAVYGEESNLLTGATTPIRSYYELSFLFHLLGGNRNPGFVPFLEAKKNYPVLGICLGFQTMNVAVGGTLYQDIPSQIYGLTTREQVLKAGRENIHSSRYIKALYPLEKELAPAFHRIKLKKNGFFVKRLKMKKKETPFILTSHHQAVKKLGKDLSVIAASMDGKIIEAVEHKKYKNVLGIQFHPEPYILYLKGKYYKKSPGGSLNFNLRSFLINNPPAMTFHKRIWQWFSRALTGSAG